MQLRYATDELSVRQAEEVLAKLVYSIEDIMRCFLDGNTGEIVVELQDRALKQTAVPGIAVTVATLMAQEKQNRALRHRVLKEKRAAGDLSRQSAEATAARLAEASVVFAGDGSVRRGAAINLYERLDRLFQKIASKFGAERRSYPSMIKLETLERCNYVRSFPQNIHLVAEIPHRLEALKRVKTYSDLNDFTRLSAYALSPAVCFHCYAELANQTVKSPVIFTAKGTCYRHEAPWRLGKYRLNEFTMREIVFAGEGGFAEQTRLAILEEVWELFESLGLNGRIETASDPFYFSEDSAKGQHQLMANSKYELIVELTGSDEAFSIASFNHVGASLCSAFEVQTEGTPLQSGCVAFGLDRWVYALLREFGPDENGWPEVVKQKEFEWKF